ncbi:MAG: MG2 domain-containing protein, partial [Pseudomonadota bacterium]|nr:MG2 domain-containing protein [Pseudomonadota bacterium]
SREQFWSSRREQHGHLRSWGTTAQGVYRTGETVQYKIYVRDDSGERLAPAPSGRYRVTVYDAAGATVHQREAVALNRFSALDGSFVLSENAAVGWYRFELKPDYAEFTLDPLQVLVADFVPAPFRVGAELRAKTATPGAAVPLHIEAKLQGGGPFSAARLRAQARLEVVAFEPKHPLAKEFTFDSADDSGRELQPVLDQTAQLDAQGEWQSTLTPPDGAVMVGRLLLEGSVEDDRGRSIVGRSSIPYFGRDRYIGVRSGQWTLQQGKAASVDALVVDALGQPQRGTPYYIKIERKETLGARVKGAGNAYITRYTKQWKRVETCKGRSTLEGMKCEFTPDAAGEFRVTAMVRDSADRLYQTHYELYAQGASAVLWEESPDYSLDLRAEQDSWTVGKTARFLVKNPFPGAQALVTVERYGVLHKSVQVLKGSTPVIEIPVLPEYVPGAYVSVVVMSPRVEAPLKGGVDLGKPTFRMGYAKLVVDEPYRHIDIKLTPDREAYRPRETVSVKLQAKVANPVSDGKTAQDEPIEFAVAVIDKAVFDLITSGTDYFDPLKGFTALDSLDLSNYSLLTQLIGRQKFEKKGANPGGDGGADLSLRSVEKFVAYWNPALAADAQGNAEISFTLPDQLTGWRVLVMAVTTSERMGLGQTDISVTKPTELRPAMPNQLAVGDQFSAGFTVLNRTDHARKIEVSIEVKGGAKGEIKQVVELATFERKTVLLPLKVETAENLQFRASAGDGEDSDKLAHEVPIRAQRVSATAADLSDLTAEQSVTQIIDVPASALSAKLSVALTPTLLGALDGAFEYQRAYPHECWEQRLSKATMAAQFLKLKPRLDPAAAWPGADQQIATVLADASSFQAPNGGMAFFVASDANVSPYLSAFTGLAFGWLRDMGHAPPAQVWDALDEYLLGVLRADPTAQGFSSREARAQLRAVALAALAQRGKVDAAELARHGEQLARMGLFGESLFWQTAEKIDGGEAWAGRARERVLARANESAGRLSLEDDDDRDWVWLLGSPVRSNCAALSALVVAREQSGIGELPQKLIRHVTSARSGRTHWNNTQENLYCAQALITYSEAYERDPVDLAVKATVGEQPLGSVQLKPTTSPVLSTAVSASGQQAVRVEATGSGRGYVSTRLQYVEPEDTPAISAGLSVQRSYAVQRGGQWQPLTPNANGELEMQQGEVLKVDLTVDAPAWMTYVVVDDPVPGGIEPLNPDLATTAGIDEQALADNSAYPWPFYHRELRFESVRHYADFIAQGRYQLSWFGQAISAGEFAIARSHVEQMYDPDVYGNGVAARLRVTARAP